MNDRCDDRFFERVCEFTFLRKRADEIFGMTIPLEAQIRKDRLQMGRFGGGQPHAPDRTQTRQIVGGLSGSTG